MSSSSKQIIIKLTSDFSSLFANALKYADYLNHLLNEQTNSLFCIETIKNGLLYVFHDLGAFEALNGPLTTLDRKKITSSDKSGTVFFLGKNLTPTNFPAGGVTISYEIVGEPKDHIFNTLTVYFESYKCPEIQVSIKKPDTFIVHFIDFNAVSLYAERIGQAYLKAVDKKILKEDSSKPSQ